MSFPNNKLAGHRVRTSSAIQKKIEELVAAVAAEESALEAVREPQAEALDGGKSMFDEVAKYRGRPLNYQFVGTGSGRGAYVEVEDGSVKLDLINGIGVHIFGHGHPRLREAAVRGALSDVVMQGNLEPNHEYAQISKMLVESASKKSRLKYAWLSTCGTMANENALKMARQKNSPAKLVIGMKNAFAGRSTMMAEVTDNPAYKEGLPEYNEVLRISWYDSKNPRSSEESLRKFKEIVAANPKQVATFVFEPMLGEGGYKTAPREFFVPILEFCREQHIAVWADEVQTFMRTGELFAFETLGIGEYIDLCTIAKTLQTGATLYTEEYNPKAGLVAGTFSGSSASLAAGIASLEMITKDGYLGEGGKIQKLHREFVGMLNRLNETTCKGQLQEAGGMGLMIAVTPLDGTKDKVNKLLQTLYKNGLIAFSCGRDPYRLRFLLPAVMTSHDVEVAAKILEKSIQEMM
ncbi:MAG: aminotransferase class III-fold pyridoxal phosphate-dependent enzyme [Bdellovibrionales bacterium]|nr:aminotransferase class III-fold pyridoxal phosphate-dependent enzyme [Bdellovibrionales bacterium]